MKFEKYIPVLAGICFSSIFGFSFLFTKEALEAIEPFHLLAFRFGIAALSLTLLWRLGLIKLNIRNKKIGLLLILALIQPVLYFICETMGLKLTTSSQAGLIISLIPVAVTIFAAVFLKEKPGKKQLFFILLSVLGVFFIIFMENNTEVNGNNLGVLILVGAVLMGGLYNILSRKLSLNFKPVEITFIMMWSGAVFFNAITAFQHIGDIKGYIYPILNIKVLISVLYLSLLSSVIAFFMMNFTLSKLKAFESAVFANLTTVISILAGVIFRNEPFYWFQIIGAIVIIIGVWGTNYFGKIKKKAEELPI